MGSSTRFAIVLLVCMGMLTVLVLPGQARAAPATPRFDLDVRSDIQGLDDTGTVTGSGEAVSFGPNIMLSDEHFPGRVISQTEPTIAVSPRDPDNLVAGFHDRFPRLQDFVCRFAFTIDGGKTWNLGGATPLQLATNFCSDPALGADAKGNFYYAYLDVLADATSSDVLVAKSTDGGKTFTTFAIAAKGNPATNFPDKEYIAVDSRDASPFKGNIYVSWTDFLNPNDPAAFDNGQIKLVVSQDGGSTWSSPVAVSPDALFPRAISGSLPVVAPDGTVYVFYADFISRTEAGPLSIKFSKSTDGGSHWSTSADVASQLPSPGRFRLKNADPNFGIIPGRGFRSNSFPTATIADDGTIFVAWVDFPNGSCEPDGTGRPPCTNSDVRLSVSRNAGGTWSAPRRVNDDQGDSDQFFPWVAAHPSGVVSIIWQDKRLDPDNIDFNTFYTNTQDGRTFLPNVRVSSATSKAGLTTFIGDYNNLAVTQDGIFPVWTDRRFANNDIFTATGTLGA